MSKIDKRPTRHISKKKLFSLLDQFSKISSTTKGEVMIVKNFIEWGWQHKYDSVDTKKVG